jgi:branched-subunit amino acid transport protein
MADCTYKAPSRKSGPKKRQQPANINDVSKYKQDRLQQLENLVEKLSERVKVAEKRNETQAQLQVQQHGETPIGVASLPIITASDSGDKNLNQQKSVSMSLPPLEHVLPIVNNFLEGFNAVLPLFHADTLLHLVLHFYSLPTFQQDPVEWAAINVVLALAHRNGLAGSNNTKVSVDYLNKVESVLSAVVLGDTRLLNVQVLVGMVFLLQASPDLMPSLLLVATTMRLAHKIGLHDRAASIHLDTINARQRAYVFWMAYILDKDLSMRSKQPAIQLDDDVDLDLPSFGIADFQINNDGIDTAKVFPGVVMTADRTAEMNYFLTRIQLAVIEGGVYDYLYSTRSLKRSAEERARALESVSCALEAWKASIPIEFSACMAPNTVSPGVLQLLAVLHSTSLACTTLLNQANAWNARWLDCMRRYATDRLMPALPSQWDAVVDEARHLAVLLAALPIQDRWNFWYVSTLTLLMDTWYSTKSKD